MNILGPDSGTIEILGRPGRPRRPRPHRLHARGARPLPAHGARGAAPVPGRASRGSRAPRRRAACRPGSSGSASPTGARRRRTSCRRACSRRRSSSPPCCTSPDVLILDEPMSGLDPVGMDLMRDVHARPAPPRHDARALEPPDGDGRAAVRPRRADQPRREGPRRRGVARSRRGTARTPSSSPTTATARSSAGLPGVARVTRLRAVRRGAPRRRRRPAAAAARGRGALRLRPLRDRRAEPARHLRGDRDGPRRRRRPRERASCWAVVRREYVERVRTKGFVIGTMLGPAAHGGADDRPAARRALRRQAAARRRARPHGHGGRRGREGAARRAIGRQAALRRAAGRGDTGAGAARRRCGRPCSPGSSTATCCCPQDAVARGAASYYGRNVSNRMDLGARWHGPVNEVLVAARRLGGRARRGEGEGR